MKPIIVINPNSTEAVTEGMDRAVAPLRLGGGPPIECLTLAQGPPGIESQEQADAIVEPVCDLIRSREETSSAFVIGCYSDPGLSSARRISSKPILGIAESAMLTAMTRGDRFGVISILDGAIPRHAAYIERLGLSARSAGDRAIGIGVTELTDAGRVLERLVSTGTALRDQDGADVLILGCAGMAPYRGTLEETLGVPVIEPTHAGVSLAMGAVLR